jgi:hypothetical protein
MDMLHVLDEISLDNTTRVSGAAGSTPPKLNWPLLEYLYSLKDKACGVIDNTDIQINDLQLQQDLIHCIEAATLAGDKLPDHVCACIYNPKSSSIMLSALKKVSLKFFLATHAAPSATYSNVCQVNQDIHPKDGNLLSYHAVKQKLEDLTC